MVPRAIGAITLKKQRKPGGRPRSQNPMVRTQVVLPQELRDALQRAAEGRAQGLSAEIRQRVEAGYALEALNPHTRQLIEDTRKLAESLALDLGQQWNENDFARKALKAG